VEGCLIEFSPVIIQQFLGKSRKGVAINSLIAAGALILSTLGSITTVDRDVVITAALFPTDWKLGIFKFGSVGHSAVSEAVYHTRSQDIQVSFLRSGYGHFNSKVSELSETIRMISE
jgi:hypothetical protein